MENSQNHQNRDFQRQSKNSWEVRPSDFFRFLDALRADFDEFFDQKLIRGCNNSEKSPDVRCTLWESQIWAIWYRRYLISDIRYRRYPISQISDIADIWYQISRITQIRVLHLLSTIGSSRFCDGPLNPMVDFEKSTHGPGLYQFLGAEKWWHAPFLVLRKLSAV